MATVQECGYKLLVHPPYSPDLAPSDHHLSADLKKRHRGRRFDDDIDYALKVTTEGWFEGQTSDLSWQGIADLPKRWEKCITIYEDYAENIKHEVSIIVYVVKFRQKNRLPHVV